MSPLSPPPPAATTPRQNWPENLAKGFVINAPSFAATAYNFIKPVLPERTQGAAPALMMMTNVYLTHDGR